ncbi:hypothetical protein B0H10DRAFT_2189548 [Mycena sp. CBHHK59/15]|nr:hypothetical protein B0H10DRAFT_2189548 [Mycena sp. CBHHK59/15]
MAFRSGWTRPGQHIHSRGSTFRSEVAHSPKPGTFTSLCAVLQLKDGTFRCWVAVLAGSGASKRSVKQSGVRMRERKNTWDSNCRWFEKHQTDEDPAKHPTHPVCLPQPKYLNRWAYNAAPGLCQVQIPPSGGRMGTRYAPPEPAQLLRDAERWTYLEECKSTPQYPESSSARNRVARDIEVGGRRFTYLGFAASVHPRASTLPSPSYPARRPSLDAVRDRSAIEMKSLYAGRTGSA